MKCKKCNSYFQQHWKGPDGLTHNLAGRLYCLSCRPFKSYCQKTVVPGLFETDTEKLCSNCKTLQPITGFSIRKFKKDGSVMINSHCRVCTVLRNKERRQDFKKRCVEYLGGKCESCGYCKCQTAFDFHHKDSTQKDFDISKMTGHFDIVKKELDKCSLLCSNCHRELHNSLSG